MVADKSGSLVGMKRHDYLPFGEEVAAGVGGRTTQQGYVGNADGNRKRWAELERDDETGLDYAQARYYSSTQGRFTSVDPGNFQAMRDLHDPQSWNAYAYVNNNPLGRTDPDGRGFWEKLKNAFNGYGWRSNEEVQQLEDKWRGWLREREKEAGGNLVNCQSGGQCQRVNIDALSRNDVFHYSASLKESIENGTVQYYSKDEIDRMSQATQIAGTAAQIPQHVQDTLTQIKQTGNPPRGYKGGGQFQNDGRNGGQVLPKADANGNPISYREYDVKPLQQGVGRGTERIVRGSDGSAWYTTDHYKTFTKIE
jgi:RHS repeat-associated protein